MNRIAVISSWAWIKVANNYGALLQYYALQQYLTRKNNYVFWIKWEFYKRWKGTRLDNVKLLLRHLLIYLSSYRCHRTFLKFCRDYLNMSVQTYTEESEADSYPIADYYITGSDQVWGGTQPECFLSFVNDNSKKIAYAASFGKGEITQEHFEKIAPWIRQFAHVSIREENGIEICRRMKVEATHLLDPTFLLDEDDYPHRQLYIKNPYIFAYLLNVGSKNDVHWYELKDYALKTNCDLKVCAVQGSEYLFCNKDLVYPSPTEWLSYYKQARCVVTNTFHGTVFAIIHHKPFLCILQRGSSANQNTRMSSLLSTLGLEDRILNCEDSIEVSINRPINWQKVSTLITDWRKKSDAFLNFLND